MSFGGRIKNTSYSNDIALVRKSLCRLEGLEGKGQVGFLTSLCGD